MWRNIILKKKNHNINTDLSVFFISIVWNLKVFFYVSRYFEKVSDSIARPKSIFYKRRHYFEIQTHYFATVSPYFNILESLSLSWSDTRSMLQDKISIFRRSGVFFCLFVLFFERKKASIYIQREFFFFFFFHHRAAGAGENLVTSPVAQKISNAMWRRGQQR